MNKFMKTVFSAIALSILLIACDKNDDNRQRTNQTTEEVAVLMQSGPWKITKYTDDRIDHTARYNGYAFTFGTGNKLTITEGANTYNGTWSVTLDDDDRRDELDFNIFISNPALLRELNEDWDVISYTSTKIVLSDDDDDPEEEMLVFEKQ